jgi:hypothetical protein
VQEIAEQLAVLLLLLLLLLLAAGLLFATGRLVERGED